MEQLIRNVADIDTADRQALEHVIGRHLTDHQQLIINVVDLDVACPDITAAPRLAQTLEDWTRVYDGLSEKEIEGVDKVAKTRANLTRDLP